MARHPVAEWSVFDAEDLWETVHHELKLPFSTVIDPNAPWLSLFHIGGVSISHWMLKGNDAIVTSMTPGIHQRAAEMPNGGKNLLVRRAFFTTITGQYPPIISCKSE